jgi:hypothetical protein
VDLAGAIAPAGDREVWFDDAQEVEAAGDEVVYERYAGAGDEPLRITLVWTDPPGEVEPEGVDISVVTGERAASVLVNDLDLEVTAPDGEVYQGNGERAEADGPDRLNNVEAVRIPDPAEGEYRIVVRAHRVDEGPQPFALVMAGKYVDLGAPPTSTPPPTDTPTAPEGGAATAVPGEGEGGEEGEDGGGLQGTLLIVVIAASAIILALLVALIVVIARQRRPAAPGPARSMPVPPSPPPTAAGQSTPTPMMPGPPSTAGAPPFSLRVRSGPQSGQRFTLQQPVVTLGRSSQNDVALHDERASRRHARIEWRSDGFHLYDENSANGTYVGETRVTHHHLQHGDDIRIGHTVLVFLSK